MLNFSHLLCSTTIRELRANWLGDPSVRMVVRLLLKRQLYGLGEFFHASLDFMELDPLIIAHPFEVRYLFENSRTSDQSVNHSYEKMAQYRFGDQWTEKSGRSEKRQQISPKCMGEENRRIEDRSILLAKLPVNNSTATHKVESRGYDRRLVGVAEMKCPYDPTADSQFYNDRIRGTEVVIPVSWIVAKYLPCAALKRKLYQGIPFTCLRHANS